ncbi:MAG: hypothetical protein ACTSPB_19985, partial [Candidatus Thorarchaeota archaeon]
MKKSKLYSGLLFISLVFLANFYMLFPTGKNNPSLELTVRTEINAKEGLFDGLTYKWNGTFRFLTESQDWVGNLTVTHLNADNYRITEWDNYNNNTDQRDVKESTRLYNTSSHWYPYNHEWLFIGTEVKVGD